MITNEKPLKAQPEYLRISARLDRVGADRRYWDGDVDTALLQIERAERDEQRAAKIERGELR